MITLPNTRPDMIANNLVPQTPTHPGEFLEEELESRGIAFQTLAKEIGVADSLVDELIKGRKDFTVEYALMIEAALGIDADFWLNLQTNYNKAKARHNTSFMAKLANIRRVAATLYS